MSRYVLSDNADDFRPSRVKTDQWDAFKEGLKCLDNAAQDIAKAGKLFSGISEPQWLKMVAMAPSPMRRTLEYTRDVGKGFLIPALATASGNYVSRLRSFPVEDQEKLLKEPVEVAITTSGGRKDKKLIRVPDMDPDQVKQVFAREGKKWKQRTIKEQRAWLELKDKLNEQSKSAEIKRPGRWTVKSGRIFPAQAKIDKGLTRTDIEKMLSDLDA